MRPEQLMAAVEIVAKRQAELTARQITYLRTYPALRRLAMGGEDNEGHFLQMACAVYGWMPRVLRVDSSGLENAVEAVRAARKVRGTEVQESTVQAVATCLFSVVGASKLLHFVNPDVYPIWDSKVQRAWQRLTMELAEPSQYYMSSVSNYLRYAQEVHQLAEHVGFDKFHEEFGRVYEARLGALGIERYPIGKVRAVEAALFELSGGEYEHA